MGYMHINNLYKDQDILLFKECWALEKIHGTSAHLSFKDGELRFFSGGENHTNFVALFDQEKLKTKLVELGLPEITIYGEAYGGKQQGMSATYGKELKFIAFDVKIGDNWLSVPQAVEIVLNLELEFVHYERITTDIETINKHRDMHSVQAIRNGMGEGKMREGVVLRPLVELTKNNGARIMCKHKGDNFKETSTPREISPEKLATLADASKVADEWVTPMRLQHVLDKLPGWSIEKMPEILKAMIEDVRREGEGEIEWSPGVEKAICRQTAIAVKNLLKKNLEG